MNRRGHTVDIQCMSLDEQPPSCKKKNKWKEQTENAN